MLSPAFGVPQGSILEPILYSSYVQDIEKNSRELMINYEYIIYADDVQLYTTCEENPDFSDLAKCLEEIKEWANRNDLKLHDCKTKLLCVSKICYSYPSPIYLKLMGQTLKVEICPKCLGFWLNKSRSISRQINNVRSKGYMMLMNFWKILFKICSTGIRAEFVKS